MGVSNISLTQAATRQVSGQPDSGSVQNSPEFRPNIAAAGEPAGTTNKVKSMFSRLCELIPVSPPIDTNNAKYNVKLHCYSPTLYSEDGIEWYRERTLLNTHSWFCDPYPMDPGKSETIRNTVKEQDEARTQTTENKISTCTLFIPLKDGETASGILGRFGRRQLNDQERKQLPGYAPARFVYAGWTDWLSWSNLKEWGKGKIETVKDWFGSKNRLL